MRIKYLLIFILFILSNCFIFADDTKLTIRNGEINIKGYNFKTNNFLQLNGEWEYYPNKLLTSNDFTQEIIDYNSILKVKEKSSKYGFGTFRVHINGADTSKIYEIDTNPFVDACKVFINGKEIFETGKVGVDIDKTIPYFNGKYMTFTTSKSSVELIVQYSAFNRKSGAPENLVKMSEYPFLGKYHVKNMIIFSFLIGAFFISSFFNMLFYIMNRKERASLHFSIFSFLVGIYSYLIFTQEMLFNTAIDYEIIHKAIYTSYLAAMFFFMNFINSLYKNIFPKLTKNILIAYLLCYELFVIFTKTYIFTQFQLLSYIVIFAYIFILILRLLKKRHEKIEIYAALIGIIAIGIFVAIDIYETSFGKTTFSYASIGILIFVLIYVIIMLNESRIRNDKLALFTKLLKHNNKELKDKNKKIADLMNSEIIQSEERLTNITKNIPSIIIGFDMDDNVVFWNDEAEKILGYKKDEVKDLECFTKNIMIKKFDNTSESLQKCAECECSILSKDNKEKKIVFKNMSGHSINKWKFWLVGNDVTEIREKEEALINSEQKYKFLYEKNASVHFKLSEDYKVADLNSYTLSFLGYEREEIIGRELEDFFEEKKNGYIREKVQSLFSTEEEDGFEVSFKTKAGKKFIVYFSPYINVTNEKFEAFGILLTGVDITKRKEMEEEILKYATYDTMTGCYNRRAGLEIIENNIKITKRNKSKLSICFIDVDGLKHVNDTLGHQDGDLLITTIIKIVKDNIRDSDIVVRLGGDEFLIAFNDCGIVDAEKIWINILKSLKSENEKGLFRFKLGASHGIVEYTDKKSANIDELIEEADKKMYEEKKAGKTQRF